MPQDRASQSTSALAALCFELAGSGGSRPPPRSLDPVIDLGMASRHRAFPGPEMGRTLDLVIAGINVPTPKPGLDLLNVVINGVVLHFATPLPQEHSQ